MDIKSAIALLRLELGLTQLELSNALHLSGATVNRWEKGHNFPNKSTTLNILKFAKDKGASAVCRQALHDAFFPLNNAVKDIDDLRYAEMEEINRIVNSSPNGVIVLEAKTMKLLYVNDMAGKYVEKPKNSAFGQTCYSFFMDASKMCTDCPLAKHRGNGPIPAVVKYNRITGRAELKQYVRCAWQGRQAYVCYSTDIDDQVVLTRKLAKANESLENRLREDHQAKLYSGKYLYAYMITNLTTGKVVEYEATNPDTVEFMKDLEYVATDKLPRSVTNNRLEKPDYADVVEKMAECIENPTESKEYVAAHQPKALFKAAQKGHVNNILEYRVRVAGNKVIWIKNDMNLWLNQNTGELFLYEYAYNITYVKITNTMISAVNMGKIIFLGSMDFESDQFDAFARYDTTLGLDIKTGSIKKETEYCIDNYISSEDTELYLRSFTIENITRQLNRNELYSFSFRSKPLEDGLVHWIETRFNWFDKKRKICSVMFLDRGPVEEHTAAPTAKRGRKLTNED